jgi:hypothetical protein
MATQTAPRQSSHRGNSSQDRRYSVLTPVAARSALMPSLQLVRSSRLVQRIAFWLLASLIAATLLMAFAPWQQTVTGSGYVVAYLPSERQQVLEATIKGRIERWNEELVENSRVAKGDFIAEIRDLDVDYATRLDTQLENTKVMLAASLRIVEATRGQLTAYRDVQQQITRARTHTSRLQPKKSLPPNRNSRSPRPPSHSSKPPSIAQNAARPKQYLPRKISGNRTQTARIRSQSPRRDGQCVSLQIRSHRQTK